MQRDLLKQRGLKKEDIQPGGLPVWSDPFEEKNKKPGRSL